MRLPISIVPRMILVTAVLAIVLASVHMTIWHETTIMLQHGEERLSIYLNIQSNHNIISNTVKKCTIKDAILYKYMELCTDLHLNTLQLSFY
jgi:hypothetical protein